MPWQRNIRTFLSHAEPAILYLIGRSIEPQGISMLAFELSSCSTEQTGPGQWQLAEALACRGKYGVTQRRGKGRHPWFTNPSRRSIALDQMYLKFCRGLFHPTHPIVVEVGLIDGAVGGRDFAK